MALGRIVGTLVLMPPEWKKASQGRYQLDAHFARGIGSIAVNLSTAIRGERFAFADLREVFAKANEEKSGDQLAGLAARTERERVAAKLVLAELTLGEIVDQPADRPRRRRGQPADLRVARPRRLRAARAA